MTNLNRPNESFTSVRVSRIVRRELDKIKYALNVKSIDALLRLWIIGFKDKSNYTPIFDEYDNKEVV